MANHRNQLDDIERKIGILFGILLFIMGMTGALLTIASVGMIGG